KHITLQNLYSIVSLLIKKSDLEDLPKEKILSISLFYFNAIKDKLPVEWNDIHSYRLAHIISLNALAIAGNIVINNNFLYKSQQPDSSKVLSILDNLKQIDWSASGDLKYLKGVRGSKMLAQDILNCLK
ncbi:hypothetical protein G6549_26690, partial [Bacillus sp. MM2020_1]|nr:hypothetical protein [Bacillus sp. MM2020_1]